MPAVARDDVFPVQPAQQCGREEGLHDPRAGDQVEPRVDRPGDLDAHVPLPPGDIGRVEKRPGAGVDTGGQRVRRDRRVPHRELVAQQRIAGCDPVDQRLTEHCGEKPGNRPQEYAAPACRQSEPGKRGHDREQRAGVARLDGDSGHHSGDHCPAPGLTREGQRRRRQGGQLERELRIIRVGLERGRREHRRHRQHRRRDEAGPAPEPYGTDPAGQRDRRGPIEKGTCPDARPAFAQQRDGAGHGPDDRPPGPPMAGRHAGQPLADPATRGIEIVGVVTAAADKSDRVDRDTGERQQRHRQRRPVSPHRRGDQRSLP